MLVGAIKLGAWVIFDEVNRIKPEILSIVSEYIFLIQDSMKQKNKNSDKPKTVTISGKHCILNDVCHIYRLQAESN